MNQATQPVKGRGTVLTAVAIAVAVVASLALASFASAAANPVAAGSKTTITLNSNFFKKLKKSGVKVLAVAPGTVSGKVVTLPIEVGSVDPAGQGELEHEGGIKFKHGKKTAVIKALVLNTATSSLTGKLGSKELKIASLSGVAATRNGFGVDVAVKSMKLTGKTATELNKKLGFNSKKKKNKRAHASKKKKKAPPKPFKSNQVLGSSSSPTQPKTIGVTPVGGVKLDIGLASAVKLAEVGVSDTAIPPAEQFSPINFAFPFAAGGNISPDGKFGSVHTAGGVLLHQEPKAFPGKETNLKLSEIWIELSTGRATVDVSVESTFEIEGKKPANLGHLGRVSIATLDMTGATIKSDPAARTVTIENGKATLEETTATVLNEVYGIVEGKAPFAAGDPLGTFTFTATTE
jgi:hypothetical protein